MSIFRMGWRCSIVEKASNGNRLPLFWHVGIPNRFCLHWDIVSVLFFDKGVSSFSLFETNDVKVNKIQQTNIFILNKWRTHSAHWPMMSKLKCSEQSGYGTLQGKDFNSFNNISFTSKFCNCSQNNVILSRGIICKS